MCVRDCACDGVFLLFYDFMIFMIYLFRFYLFMIGYFVVKEQ